MFDSIRAALLRLSHQPLRVWYDPAYRLPLPSLSQRFGVEPRRADLVTWFLRTHGAEERVRAPKAIAYEELLRVHEAAYLATLTSSEGLCEILGCSPDEAPLEEILRTVRLACGGTLEAARHALKSSGPAMNLLGGFHRAGRANAVGLSIVNDVAVAVAALRHEGYGKRIGLLDLDAHLPDPAALAHDASGWMGSLSPEARSGDAGIDHVILPSGAQDEVYLAALHELLGRIPKGLGLIFVIAGGDVLAGDRNGGLEMSVEGARLRDRRVLEAIDGRPSVWLPGGGFGPDAWRVLAGTALELTGAREVDVPKDIDPLSEHVQWVGESLSDEQLRGEASVIGESEIAADLHLRLPTRHRLLGYYTAEGLELALERYGFLGTVKRLGYQNPHIVVDSSPPGDRVRLLADAIGESHLLVEAVLERMEIDGEGYLFVHWLTLRHPLANRNEKRPLLPGQEHPGLGMAREAGELLRQIARRLQLLGVAFRPAWFHTAYAARHRMHFVHAERQRRFEALIEAGGERPLAELTQAVADGKVTLDGEIYVWEPDVMVDELRPRPRDEEESKVEPGRFRFEE